MKEEIVFKHKSTGLTSGSSSDLGDLKNKYMDELSRLAILYGKTIFGFDFDFVEINWIKTDVN